MPAPGPYSHPAKKSGDYGSTPEPVDLVTQAVETARASVPPEKLVLGISAPTETAESIFTKVGIAKRCGLGGIAIWRLGLVTAGMWDALRNTVVPER
jgi:spore germination protein YaaH